MFRLVFAIGFVAVALGATVPDATLDPDFIEWEGRIVGGSDAHLGQFPYQASMRSAANAHFCGGFIIRNNWIGCAAHCTISRTPANTRVVVGTLVRTQGDLRETNLIINHPAYSGATIRNDVSLIRLVVPLTFTANVGPIALASSFLSTANNARASGWGQTSHPGSAALNLQWVGVDVITNEVCRSRLSATQAARIFDSTICTSSPIGEGMCMGDSGGPLTYAGAVVGAVSWGVPCGRGSPDMFARISYFRDWFYQEMDRN